MNKMNKKSGPLYIRIYRELKVQIENGILKSGEIMPTENDLCKKYEVSRITMRKALQKLKDEGHLKRHRGYGTEIISTKDAQLKLIGLVLVDINSEGNCEIITEAQNALYNKGYQAIIYDTRNSAEKEKEFLTRHEENMKGFLITPATGKQNLTHYARLLRDKVNFVFFDRYVPELNINSVVSDNVSGGYLAAEHLVSLGHKRIAILTEPEATSNNDRIKGFFAFLKKNKIDEELCPVLCSDERNYSAGYTLLKRLYNKYKDITAAFCVNDDIAWGALNGLHEMGVKVPTEFSLLGYDNQLFSKRLIPSLSTIAQPRKEIIRRAADLLIEIIEGKRELTGNVETLPVSLVKRNSTAKPKR